MRISVILPTMNRRRELPGFLEHLLAQTRLPEELVVVDAGSDPVQDLLSEALEGTPVALIYTRAAPGTSTQRNIGIDRSRGEILFFLDDDMMLEPDYIERSLECFALDYDPPVGGVMGTCTNEPSGSLERTRRLLGLTHDSPEGQDPALYTAGGVRWLARPRQVTPVPVAGTGRVAYRRECLEAERFDDFLPGYTYAEDVELAFRIAKRWTIVQTPHARLFHKHSPAARVSLPDRSGRVLYSRFYFFRRHRRKTPRNLAAFAWSTAGLTGWLLATGVARRAGVRPMLRGIAGGYRRCLDDLLPQGG